MKIYAQFDNDGVMTCAISEEYITNINEYLNLGYKEISEEDMQKYLGSLYVRGVEGIPIEKPLDLLKKEKLKQIELWTRNNIIGGFTSSVKGKPYTYDSSDTDQLTFQTMYAASKSPDFSTTEPYFGTIPIRAIAEGASEKEVLAHNAAEVQKLLDDLALHIGAYKQKGWQLQQLVKIATCKKDLEDIKM